MREILRINDTSHIPALVALMNECQPHFDRDVELTKKWFLMNQHRVAIFGVFEDDVLIAYAATEWTDESFLFGEGGVSRDYRGQGIASDTIKWVCRHYWDKGLRIARILTQKHYIKQQLLYQKLGFKIQGYTPTKSKYPDCWMVKHLTEDNL